MRQAELAGARGCRAGSAGWSPGLGLLWSWPPAVRSGGGSGMKSRLVSATRASTRLASWRGDRRSGVPHTARALSRRPSHRGAATAAAQLAARRIASR